MSSLPANQNHTGDKPLDIGVNSRSGRRISWALVILLLTALLISPPDTLAEPAIPDEYSVKAALIYSIIKFVDWPESEKSRSNSPLCIAVLGQDPFGSNFDVISSKNAKGRPIEIRRLQRVEDIRGCEVLFISSSERRQLSRILKQLRNQPVLTVADHGGFSQAGGIINMITVNNRVQFEINNNAALRAQLRISSQLLKLAKIVTE